MSSPAERSNSVPSAVVLGVDSPIGLTVARELGRHGVRVHGIGASRWALGRFSRFVDSFEVRPAADVPLEQWLPHIAERVGATCVMTVSERDLLALDAARDRLPGLKLLIPPRDALAAVLDKRETLRAAREIGIDTPREYDGARVVIEGPPPGLRYPVVLKWPDPNRIAKRLSERSIPLVKAQFCADDDALRAALERYRDVGELPLVQEYAAGLGLGQMILMKDGEALLVFQHRRIHEWPPEGGVSTVCESVAPAEHADLMEKSVELLRTLGWQGPAMVEYRYDPSTNRAVLMEINGRFWGSLPLASHAGAQFGWATFATFACGLALEPPRIRPGIQARFMIPETRRLVRVLFQADRIQDPAYRNTPLADLWAFLAGFVRPRSRYYVFDWRDPLPAVMDLVGVVVRRVVPAA